MVTSIRSTRLWLAGFMCLMACSASAQERTAEFGTKDTRTGQQIQPVTYAHGHGHYQNAYANYPPGFNVYPNHRDPNRGFVAYGFTKRIPAKHNRPDDCTKGDKRLLGCLCNWDFGYRVDVIALDPGYSHPNDWGTGYAAQGYGGPVFVPQAPVVRSNFNYGWGIPSSRLTPTSLPAGR